MVLYDSFLCPNPLRASECLLSALPPYLLVVLVLCDRIYPSSCNSQGWIPSLFISFARMLCCFHSLCFRWTCGYFQARGVDQSSALGEAASHHCTLRCLSPSHGWQLQLLVRKFCCCRPGRKEVSLQKCWPQACPTTTGMAGYLVYCSILRPLKSHGSWPLTLSKAGAGAGRSV